MTLENVKKQYNHYCKLAKGEFTERDFDRESGNNEGDNEVGITIQGKMTPQRVELIKGNALRHKTEIERKYPVQFPIKPVEIPKVTKSKSKEVK